MFRLGLVGLPAIRQLQYQSLRFLPSSTLLSWRSFPSSVDSLNPASCKLAKCRLHSNAAQLQFRSSAPCPSPAGTNENVKDQGGSPRADSRKATKSSRKEAVGKWTSFLQTAVAQPFKLSQKAVESRVLQALKDHPHTINIYFFNSVMQYYLSIDRMKIATELLFLLLSRQGKHRSNPAPKTSPMKNPTNTSEFLRHDLVTTICSLPFVSSPNNFSYSILLKSCARKGRTHLARQLVSAIRKQEELARAMAAKRAKPTQEGPTKTAVDFGSIATQQLPSIRVSATHIMHWINAWNKHAQLSLNDAPRGHEKKANQASPSSPSANSTGESLFVEVTGDQLDANEQVTSADHCYEHVKNVIKQANDWNISLDDGVYIAVVHSASLTGDIEETERWEQQLAEHQSKRTNAGNEIVAVQSRVIADTHLYVASLINSISPSRDGSSPSSLTSITPSLQSRICYEKMILTLRESIALQASQKTDWNEVKQDQEFFLQLQALYIKRILPPVAQLSQLQLCQFSLAHLEKMADDFTVKHGNQQAFPLSIALYQIAIGSCERQAQAYAAVTFFSTFIHREVNSNQAQTDEAIYQTLLKVLMLAKDWSSCVGVLDRIDTVDKHVILSSKTWHVLSPLLPQIREQEPLASTATTLHRTPRSPANVMQDLVNAQALFQEWTTPATSQPETSMSAATGKNRSHSRALKSTPSLTPGATVAGELRSYLQQLLLPIQ